MIDQHDVDAEWWRLLCSRLRELQQSPGFVRTRTGVENEIVAIKESQGWVELKSARAHSGTVRRITRAMIETPGSTHRSIRQVLHAMAFAPQVRGWRGAVRISDLLARCLDDAMDWPPDDALVYLVSRLGWQRRPTSDCDPLYVGSTTGRSKRFVTRIGDLIADAHGFYGRSTGHHSGGQALYRWCKTSDVHPGGLWLGWYLDPSGCRRCAERHWYRALAPRLSMKSPPACRVHAEDEWAALWGAGGTGSIEELAELTDPAFDPALMRGEPG